MNNGDIAMSIMGMYDYLEKDVDKRNEEQARALLLGRLQTYITIMGSKDFSTAIADDERRINEIITKHLGYDGRMPRMEDIS